MTLPPPDIRERRGDRVLLVWGDAPWWTVIDPQADRFIGALVEGKSPAAALAELTGGRADYAVAQAAAGIIRRLKSAGVLARRPRQPARDRIESIAVNITNRCPLRCAFCYNQPELHQDRAELSGLELAAALDGLRRYTAPGALLAILGGEPLLRPADTLDLARWARRRGLRPMVSTNGLYVDDAFARGAAECGLDVQVSLDGPDAAGHEAVRGPGTFDRALAGVARLVEAGALVVISMVVHAGNLTAIEPYLRLAQRLGVAEARCIAVRQMGPGQAFEPPKPVNLLRAIWQAADSDPALAGLLGRDFASIFAQTCHGCAPRRSCGTGSQTLLLDADGTLYPCPNFVGEAFAAGNVRSEPPARVWRRSAALAEVRRQTALAARRPCGGCWARHWCLGGCAGESYAVHGEFGRPGVACAGMKEAVREVFWRLADRPLGTGSAPRPC
ncbi:MAG: radical SAM protein [Armatimonadetes bacterium]|nr:radical SAM protein [Armatimonadota bacterium]